MSESDRVFSNLQLRLTSVRFTMTEDQLEALLLLHATARTVLRRTTCSSRFCFGHSIAPWQFHTHHHWNKRLDKALGSAHLSSVIWCWSCFEM